jgi:hypothetical protein
MKTIHLILCVALFGTACSPDDRTSVAQDFKEVSSAQSRAMSWLAQQQRADGYWGTDQHRVTLTSLAVLAFLSDGETPSSNVYGKFVENGLRALLRDTEEREYLPPADEALLTWCLAEAYGMTRVPVLRDSARKRGALLNSESATPWHAFAARALQTSEAAPEIGTQMLSNLKSRHSVQTNNILDEATHLLLSLYTVGREDSTPNTERFRRLDPKKNWRSSDRPVQTVAVLSIALLVAGGGKDWMEWSRSFFPDVCRRQVITEPSGFGWWTAESLGIQLDSETEGMTPNEERIYITSLMQQSLQWPRRIHPSFQTIHDIDEREHDQEDIDIEIEL